ncbi:uncharacterized protein LOC124892812 [Capsicum annuum]|uniref:uncharacterized protein LOC124892812 n=1 Tax=Capsicum annuum TaxID=4072 RepID=UPI001FB0FDD0|nr:uncharacterized protein LOC124892812 [Capsicum annuum]
MLFWKENENIDNCVVCGSSRWKSVGHASANASSKIPAKVLRFFSILICRKVVEKRVVTSLLIYLRSTQGALLRLEDCCTQNKQSTAASTSFFSENSGGVTVKSSEVCSPTPASPAHRCFIEIRELLY